MRNLVNILEKLMHTTKGSFLWDPESGYEFKQFPAKNQASNWYRLARPGFWRQTTWTPVLTRISEEIAFDWIDWNVSLLKYQKNAFWDIHDNDVGSRNVIRMAIS